MMSHAKARFGCGGKLSGAPGVLKAGEVAMTFVHFPMSISPLATVQDFSLAKGKPLPNIGGPRALPEKSALASAMSADLEQRKAFEQTPRD